MSTPSVYTYIYMYICIYVACVYVYIDIDIDIDIWFLMGNIKYSNAEEASLKAKGRCTKL